MHSIIVDNEVCHVNNNFSHARLNGITQKYLINRSYYNIIEIALQYHSTKNFNLQPGDELNPIKNYCQPQPEISKNSLAINIRLLH